MCIFMYWNYRYILSKFLQILDISTASSILYIREGFIKKRLKVMDLSIFVGGGGGGGIGGDDL